MSAPTANDVLLHCCSTGAEAGSISSASPLNATMSDGRAESSGHASPPETPEAPVLYRFKEVPHTSLGKRESSHGDEAEWSKHRAQIVRMYWQENQSIRQVRETMKREHGFDKSAKMYKYRFRKWGVRKNIKGHEALEIASCQEQSFKFWPVTRGSEYQNRISRHLRNKKVDNMSSWEHKGFPYALPGRIRAPDLERIVEQALYYSDIYLERLTCTRSSTWVTRPSSLGDHEDFFDLYTEGLSDLSRHLQPNLAFGKINKAFDHLKGLLLADHPFIYYRIAGKLASCRTFPASQVCFRVCRLLAVYCLQLSHLLHGTAHPLNHWWMAFIKFMDSGELGHFDYFLENTRILASKYVVRVPGLLHIAAYVPSEMRGQEEQALRHRIEATTLHAHLISEAQEARLALVELLLDQGATDEALQLVAEADALRRLDPVSPSTKAFWISELFWRAGELDKSLDILRESLKLIEAERQIAPLESAAAIDELQVLNILRYKLEWLRRTGDYEEISRLLAPMMANRSSPLIVHFLSGDLEAEIDVKYTYLGGVPRQDEDQSTPFPIVLPIRPS